MYREIMCFPCRIWDEHIPPLQQTLHICVAKFLRDSVQPRERKTHRMIERKRGQAKKKTAQIHNIEPGPCEPTHRGRGGGNREIKEKERIRHGLCARASTVSSLLRTMVSAVSFSSQTHCRLTKASFTHLYSWNPTHKHKYLSAFGTRKWRVHPPPVYKAVYKEIIRFFPLEQTV